MYSQPIAPNTLLDDLHPSRFLKVADLRDRWHVTSVTVTISRMAQEETVPNPKDIDPATNKPRIMSQPVLYFSQKNGTEFPRGYLVSAQVDVQSLKTATKAETVGDVIGKKIVILIGEHRKQAVLRISPMPPEFPHVDGYVSGEIIAGNAKKPGPKQTGEVIEATCKKCGMLAQVNPETQRFYSHQNVAGENCDG